MTDAPHMVVDPPGPRSQAMLDRLSATLYVGHEFASVPFVVHRKEGHVIEDVDGNRYIDMASGWGSTPLGAVPEAVIDATIKVLPEFGNEDIHHMTNVHVAPLAERLLTWAPDSLERVDIALSGTEAVEIALRLMRRATGRPLVIGFHGQYHGESAAAVGLGAEIAEISAGMRELTPGFVHVPYPNAYRSPFGRPRIGGTGDTTMDYVRDQLLFHAIDPDDVAGVVIEPIVGEGGVLIPPDTFWPALVDLCEEHGWLLCVDEVESGMGRTGPMFAVEHWGIKPDLMCLGKAVSGGVMPLAAVLGSEAVMGTFSDTKTGSTCSWLPAACAGALAALDVYEHEDVLGNVRRLEAAAVELLMPLLDRYEVVGDVRVKGTYIAVEFVRDRVTKERFPEFQHAVELETVRRGLVGIHHNASLRVLPGLTMPVDLFRRGLTIIDEAIGAVLASGLPS